MVAGSGLGAWARQPPSLRTPRAERCTAGQTRSEGGFAANKVAIASVLDVQEASDKKGRKYYKYEVLTRTGEREEEEGKGVLQRALRYWGVRLPGAGAGLGSAAGGKRCSGAPLAAARRPLFR